MRVALSNDAPVWGGAETFTASLARGLSQRGHRVLLLCRPESPLADRLVGHVEIHPVLRSSGFSIRQVVRIHGILRSEAPDVLLMVGKRDARTAGIAARLEGIPVVARRGDDRPYRRGIRHRVYHGWVPVRHVANSHAVKRTLLGGSEWLRDADVEVIHNGVDLHRIDGAGPPPFSLPAGAVALGYVGRMEPLKGVLDLVEAWRTVARAVPEAHLVLAGEGSLEAEVKRRVARDPRVTWLGHRHDVPAVLRGLDLLVLPSRTEAFGYAVSEALAAGVPVIATRTGGIPEMVSEGIDARLVPPENPGALADALIDLLRDEACRRRMGLAGRDRIRREFSLERMLDRYEALLRACSRESRASPTIHERYRGQR